MDYICRYIVVCLAALLMSGCKASHISVDDTARRVVDSSRIFVVESIGHRTYLDSLAYAINIFDTTINVTRIIRASEQAQRLAKDTVLVRSKEVIQHKSEPRESITLKDIAGLVLLFFIGLIIKDFVSYRIHR